MGDCEETARTTMITCHKAFGVWCRGLMVEINECFIVAGGKPEAESLSVFKVVDVGSW